MNIIKALIVVCFIFIANTGIAQKLDQSNYKQKAKSNAESMRVALNLTNDQVGYVIQVMEKFLHALSMPPSSDSSPEARKNRLSKANFEKEQEMKKILNSVQWDLYVKHMELLRKKTMDTMEERKKMLLSKPNN